MPGVGDGYAAKWINQYGSLDAICEHADEVTGKKGEALRANIDQVKLNRKVNALVRDVDLGVDIEDLTFGSVDVAQIDALFKELEFGPRTKTRVMKIFNGGVSQLEPPREQRPHSRMVLQKTSWVPVWTHRKSRLLNPRHSSSSGSKPIVMRSMFLTTLLISRFPITAMRPNVTSCAVTRSVMPGR